MRSFIIRLGLSAIFCIIIVSWYFIPDSFFVNYSDATVEDLAQRDEIVITENKKEVEVQQEEYVQEVAPIEILKTQIKDDIKQSVPFIVQAPHAQWDDPRYQDACEEASLLMAYAWINNDGYISKNNAEEEIEKMFIREREIFGDVVDTSVADTAKFFSEYYGHKVEVYENITMEEMYQVISDGGIIIVPTDGTKLGNPNFTNGGPERHMLVVIGYDRDNKEFITNDPGTRVGRGYKYKDSTLYNAIRDYKTGNKEPIDGAKKDVIIVRK